LLLTGGDDVQDILDGISNQVTTCTGETCTLEDVDDVVHHDIHTRQLRPHLKGTSEEDTASDTGSEQVKVGFGTFSALKMHLGLNFLKLEHHKLVLLVTTTVKISKNLKSFFFAVMVDEPTRTIV
jgi:hypothetical protein